MKVLLETNANGDGDYFRLLVNDKVVDEGHSVNVWTIQYLVDAIETAADINIVFDRKDYGNDYFL